MKNFSFLIPIILFLGFSILGNRMLASGSFNPIFLVIVIAIFLVISLLVRPKKKTPKPASEVEEKVMGDYAKNAFADDPQRNAQFRTALKNYAGNMPKAALSKLEKLAPLCKTDEEVYAVAMATAMTLCSLNKYKEAIRQYNKAIVLNPTSELAMTLGSCHQRLGELTKARDSYEFALDLDAGNLEARSILATTYVADGDYETALEQAMLVLEKDEKHASSLATAAISYGLLNDTVLSKQYTKLAAENGYSEKKINNTISALKKR